MAFDVISSTLLVSMLGLPPATEFFLTVTISASFLFRLGREGSLWLLDSGFLNPVLGSLIGGVGAALNGDGRLRPYRHQRLRSVQRAHLSR